MSLDVYLRVETPITKKATGVFLRVDGTIKELTLEEVKENFPEAVGIYENEYETTEVYSNNITSNLMEMAEHAGLYPVLWGPNTLLSREVEAGDLISHLEGGLLHLTSKPEYFKLYNPPNGWGTYDQLVLFVKNYISACKKYPKAKVYIGK